MASKWRDSQVRREILEFNREFLELVCAEGASPYGLAPAVSQRLRLLGPAQREAVAATPCLLAAFGVFPARPVAHGVADAPTLAARGPQADAARLFAASLLTWLWHTARQDRLLAALCVGPGGLAVEQLGSAGFRDLQRAAAAAAGSLEARFCRHPRLWPDLVRAAGIPDGPLVVATRLSVVQLTLICRR